MLGIAPFTLLFTYSAFHTLSNTLSNGPMTSPTSPNDPYPRCASDPQSPSQVGGKEEELKQLFLDRVFHAGEPEPPSGFTRRQLHRMRMAEAKGEAIDINGVIGNSSIESDSDGDKEDPDETDRNSKSELRVIEVVCVVCNLVSGQLPTHTGNFDFD